MTERIKIMLRLCRFHLRNRKMFTIIELLIVVSIIAILAAVLLPALNMVREKSRSINCSSNLKQVGLAFLQYANDYDDLVLYMKNSQSWPRYVLKNDGYVSNATYLNASLGYLPRKAAICPSDPGGWKEYDDFNRLWYGMYGMAEWIANMGWKEDYVQQLGDFRSAANGNKERCYSIKQMKSPTRTQAAGDTYYQQGNTGSCLFGNGSTSNSNYSRRHLGKGNMLFYDGHVETMSKQSLLALPVPIKKSWNEYNVREDSI